MLEKKKNCERACFYRNWKYYYEILEVVMLFFMIFQYIRRFNL